MPGRTSWRSAWLPFACWIVVIFGLSSVPDWSPPQVGIPMTDKLAHLGEYGVLGALFARARPGRRSAGHTLVAGFLLGSAIGTLDEAYQSGTPGRQVSVLDGLADAIGAAAGSIAWMGYVARRRTGTGAGNDTTR